MSRAELGSECSVLPHLRSPWQEPAEGGRSPPAPGPHPARSHCWDLTPWGHFAASTRIPLARRLWFGKGGRGRSSPARRQPPGPGHRFAIIAEEFQLPLRGRNKAQLVSRSHQLILIDTTLHSESSTRSQFTFLLNHTGKLEALLLPSDSIRVLYSPTIHRVGKHPGPPL